MGLFVKVKIDQSKFTTQQARELCVRSCPVDAMKATEAGIEVTEENEDECILCDLCIRSAPEGSIQVVRTYQDYMPK